MSIQEYMTNQYLGYLFAFGPVSLYLSILAYAVYKDFNGGCRQYITFKVVKGSWNEFWGPMFLFLIISIIAPIGWIAISMFVREIYKNGALYPGSYAKIRTDYKEANEKLQKLEKECIIYHEKSIQLMDKCEHLENNVRSYHWHLQCISDLTAPSDELDKKVSSKIDYDECTAYIEKEIEHIKRVS